MVIDPPPYVALPGRADAGVLFLCDHASNALPAEYGDLGLPEAQRRRHIAYDIGAAGVARTLARLFDAPALLTTVSRLLIDPNRGADDPTLVMRLSDGAVVPGNARIDAAEVARRRLAWWQPYRAAAEAQADAMLATGRVPAVVSIHSFTPVWRGAVRPWHVGVLWDRDPRLPLPFLEALRAEGGLVVGDNAPYDGALEGDTIDAVATARGLPNILVEVRQDLIGADAEAEAWGERLARVLRPLLALPGMERRTYFGSRAGRPGRHPETGTAEDPR